MWQIVLDRPAAGDLTLALDFGQTTGGTGSASGTLAEPAASEADPAAVVPVLALRNVSRQSGMVAVEAASDQQIDCQPENLREWNPANVPAQSLRRRPPDRCRLSISAIAVRADDRGHAHAPESVLTAICEAAEIRSLAGGQGRMRHQARFWLRSPNLPQVPVVLPDGADLWSVMLDGKPVEVRRKQGAYIVPLPAATARAAGATRELTLWYETCDPPPAAAGSWGWERLWPQTVRQTAPKIALTTLGAAWRVQPPEGWIWSPAAAISGRKRRWPARRWWPAWPKPSPPKAPRDCRGKSADLVAAVVFAGFLRS